jgi:hypothetical protein
MPVTADGTQFDMRPFGFWREGELLAVQGGATLPARCIETGSAAPLTPVTLRVEWSPRWTMALAILVPVFGVLVARSMRRRAELTMFATPQVHAQRDSAQRLGKVLQWIPLGLCGLGFALWFGGGLDLIGFSMFLAGLLLAWPLLFAGAWIVALNGLAKVARIEDDIVYLRVGRGYWAGLASWQPVQQTLERAPAHSPFA